MTLVEPPTEGASTLVLHDIVARHARARPDAVALIFEGRVTSYSELDTRSRELSERLKMAGVVRGERIVFIGRNSDAVPILALACNRIGAVPVPINWRLAPAEMAALIMDAEARIVFVEPEFAATTGDVGPRVRADLALLDATAIHTREPIARLPGETTPTPIPEEPADEIALQIYTSGTTGRPKGVMLSHRNLNAVNAVRHLLQWDDWSDDDVTLVSAPLGHVGAFGMVVRSLFFGGAAVIQPTFDAARTLEAIEWFGVSKIALVPTAIRMVLDHPRASSIRHGRVETIIYGASPISPSLLTEAMATFGCGFAQSYGMSETSGPVVALAPGDHVLGSARITSAGRPMPGTEVRIVAADGSDLPVGEEGEIWIRSQANMVGYWRQPDETAKTLARDGWLRTGDAGHLDDEGYVYVRGRVKEMIISGAENIYPAEVENAISGHPDVAEVAVIGVPDPRWGEAVLAFVTSAAGRRVDEEDVRSWARSTIAGYKVPKHVRVLDALPHNASGKIDKLALRALAVPTPAHP